GIDRRYECQGVGVAVVWRIRGATMDALAEYTLYLKRRSGSYMQLKDAALQADDPLNAPARLSSDSYLRHPRVARAARSWSTLRIDYALALLGVLDFRSFLARRPAPHKVSTTRLIRRRSRTVITRVYFSGVLPTRIRVVLDSHESWCGASDRMIFPGQ